MLHGLGGHIGWKNEWRTFYSEGLLISNTKT